MVGRLIGGPDYETHGASRIQSFLYQVARQLSDEVLFGPCAFVVGIEGGGSSDFNLRLVGWNLSLRETIWGWG